MGIQVNYWCIGTTFCSHLISPSKVDTHVGSTVGLIHKGVTDVLSQVISSCMVDYEGGFSSWIRRERRCQVKRNMPMQVNCWLLLIFVCKVDTNA